MKPNLTRTIEMRIELFYLFFSRTIHTIAWNKAIFVVIRFEDRDAGDNGCHGLVLALRPKKKIKKNQPSAKYAEGVVCCLIASTMRTRAILVVLIDTEMVSITITTINRCGWSIGREPTRDQRT
jgi:hypothetical protein